MSDNEIRPAPPIDQLREHLRAAREIAFEKPLTLAGGGQSALIEHLDKSIEIAAGPSTPPPVS